MRLVVLAFAMAALAVAAVPCQAAGFRLEAESMIASNNLGGDPIAIVSCSGASGGHAVYGLDNPGEWIEVRLEISAVRPPSSIPCAARVSWGRSATSRSSS